MRKKHVFKESEVAHVFFHRDEKIDDNARNSRNSFSWKGDKFYSYLTEIGRVYDWDKKIILLRGGSYSTSTSKHQSYINYAIPPGWYRIYFNWGDYLNWKEYARNTLLKIIHYKNTIHTALRYIPSPEETLTDLKQLKNTLQLVDKEDLYYKDMYLLKLVEWTEEEIDLYNVKSWAIQYGIKGATKNKIKWYNNPVLKAKAEEKVEIDKWSKEIKFADLSSKITGFDATTAYRDPKLKVICEEEYAKLIEKEEAERLEKLKESIRKWQSGEINYFNSYDIPIHFRLLESSEEVVTSRGAKVPVKHAKLLYKQLLKCIEKDEPWFSNGHTIKVGYYKVENITRRLRSKYPNITDWCITAGCHKIFYKEVKQFIEFYKLDW